MILYQLRPIPVPLPTHTTDTAGRRHRTIPSLPERKPPPPQLQVGPTVVSKQDTEHLVLTSIVIDGYWRVSPKRMYLYLLDQFTSYSLLKYFKYYTIETHLLR